MPATRKLGLGASLVAVAAVMIAVFGARLWWTGLAPSVSPDDVLLTVLLQPASPDLREFAPEYPWELVVQVGPAGTRTLYDSDGRYRHDVYPFSPDRTLGGPDYLLGWRAGTTIVPEEITSIGANGATLARAVKLLKDEGYLPSSYSDLSAYSPGFSHLKPDGVTRVRYHLKESSKPQPLAVVYVHEERRWGKDLGWVMVVYAAPSQ